MSQPPQPGDQAPDFRLPSTAGEIVGSELWRDAKLVLAFYTEDGTPACQAQAQTLAEDLPLIEELGARLVAISADPLDSHARFAERLGGVPYPLASDLDLTVARAYGVADEEQKRSRRAVFVIDRGGVVIYANPWFSAASPEQRLALLEALGAAF
ncbi:MAG: peroxiredoxin [Chloroflexota bacterium]|nr:peroxiredoxin [Dehalococcoidia bacterium]MDW8252373.1 peroxiredoxin [Chloroflexota bacterium]